ncbi:MAG: hypothetical protein WBV95_11700 [Desulfobacterales bacterium]
MASYIPEQRPEIDADDLIAKSGLIYGIACAACRKHNFWNRNHQPDGRPFSCSGCIPEQALLGTLRHHATYHQFTFLFKPVNKKIRLNASKSCFWCFSCKALFESEEAVSSESGSRHGNQLIVDLSKSQC